MDLDIFCLSVLGILFVIDTSESHSWLACTDYSQKNAAIYEHSKCRGYARGAAYKAPRHMAFGTDTGFDNRPKNNNPCQAPRDDSVQYNDEHPTAVYYLGQQVVLAHPMKNHGSDTRCTSQYIVDNGNKLYRGEVNAATDPTLSEFRAKTVADLGKSPSGHSVHVNTYPKPGYQNAPLFCNDTDKSIGTFSFNVPTDLETGRYTFMWLWEFNKGELYSTCFEVDIVQTQQERNSILTSRGELDLSEPCGLLTSDGVTMGNANPGCSEVETITTSTTKKPTTTTKIPQSSTKFPPTESSSTQSTPTTTTTTTRQQTTTRRPVPGSKSLAIASSQMTGIITLPSAPLGTIRRIITVHWDCPAQVNFWGARVVAVHNIDNRKRRKRELEGTYYDLIQEGALVESKKFHYHATFTSPCDYITNPPRAQLLRDDL